MAFSLDLYFLNFVPPSAAEVAAKLMRSLRPPGFGKGSPTPKGRLHNTLHRLGSYQVRVPQNVLDQAMAAGLAAADQYEPFGASFDRFQSKGEPGKEGIAQLTSNRRAMSGLRNFQRGLGLAMYSVGCTNDQIRSNFRPHITLDYKTEYTIALRAVEPIAWPVTDFCLVISHVGESRHEVLQRWPLRGMQKQLFEGW